MKHFITFFLALVLLSCSSNDDEISNDNNNNNGNNTTNGRYKISFNAIGNAGEKHFKATYKFDNGNPIVQNYDGFVTPSGFATGDATQRIDLEIEMTKGNSYLRNIQVKVEDLQTGTVKYELLGFNTPNQYIISPDMLTEFSFLSNLYGYSISNPKNNYKTKYHAMISYTAQGGLGISESDFYDYRQDILSHKVTRGSLRISIENNHYLPSGQKGDYILSISPNAWLIKDNSSNPNNGFYNVLEATSTLNNGQYINNTNTNKTYELILPSNMSNVNINLKGMNVKANISIMKKNGTLENVNIISTNNQIQTQTFSNL